MRTSTVIILAIAISMGGSAAYLTRTWLKDQTRASAAVQPTGTIVVAAESLAYGTAMTSDNVAEIPGFRARCPMVPLRSRMICSTVGAASCSPR